MARIQIIAIIVSFGLLIATIELVRRRKLTEKYSLLWLLASTVLAFLSIERRAVDAIAPMLGIFYAPALLFLAAMVFFVLILLHFSTVISELSEKNTELAQRVAILTWHIKQRQSDKHRDGGQEGK